MLAIELGELAGTARILGGNPPHAGAIVRTAAGPAVAYFDGEAALAEYLTRHFGRFARSVIGHPLYSAFVGAAPGIRELMAIGKVRDEFVLQRRWDVVVVDAGASGHALEYVRMPSAAAATFARGRVHREAEANAALLRDRTSCAIHVVATPEQMPLREAVDTVHQLRALELATGAVFINRCLAVAPPGVDAAVTRLANPVLAAALAAAVRRQATQEREIAAVENELMVRALRIPHVHAGDELTRLRALVQHVEVVAA